MSASFPPGAGCAYSFAVTARRRAGGVPKGDRIIFAIARAFVVFAVFASVSAAHAAATIESVNGDVKAGATSHLAASERPAQTFEPVPPPPAPSVIPGGLGLITLPVAVLIGIGLAVSGDEFEDPGTGTGTGTGTATGTQ